MFWQNAHAGVRNREPHPVAQRHTGQREIVCAVQVDVLQAQRQPAAVGHGIAGVDGQVEQNLAQPRRVRIDKKLLRLPRGDNLDVLRQETPQQLHFFHQQRAQINCPLLQRPAAAEVKDLTDQLGGLLHLLHDRGKAGLIPCVEAGRPAQQLTVEENDTHQVVEVMGNARGELADRGEPLLAAVLALHQPLLRHVAHEQHPAVARRPIRGQRAGDHLVDRFANVQFVPLARRRRCEQFAQRPACQRAEGSARRICGEPGQQSFGHRVGMLDTQAAVQQQHAVGHAAHDLSDLRGLVAQLLVGARLRCLQLQPFKHGMDGHRQTLDVLRCLDHVVGRAAAHGRDRDLLGTGASDDHHRDVRFPGVNRVDDLKALEAEDVEIAQDEVVAAIGQPRLELGARSGLDDLKAAVLPL